MFLCLLKDRQPSVCPKRHSSDRRLGIWREREKYIVRRTDVVYVNDVNCWKSLTRKGSLPQKQTDTRTVSRTDKETQVFFLFLRKMYEIKQKDKYLELPV